MFEDIDLSKKMSREEYEQVIPPLIKRMGELQREAERLQVQVIVVFEGMDVSGKGVMINRLIHSLDPRGYDVYDVSDPADEERSRPFFWRFWVKTPRNGRISIFSRSWYHRTIVERRDGKRDPDAAKWTGEINYFERELADDHFLFLKFYLHISKKEQKERYKKLEKDPATRWMVTDREWEYNKKYDKYLHAMESLMEKTDTAYAPWIIVEANDRKFAEVKMFAKAIGEFEKAIADAGNRKAERPALSQAPLAMSGVRTSALDSVDLSKSMSDAEYATRLPKYEDRARKAQMKAFTSKVPVIVLFEGWDAAGKGGDIKRLTDNTDPRGYTVVPIGVPDEREIAHNYLWRFWTRFPAAGHVTIFDRSWYGRVLVERVEGLCSTEEWQRAYREINEMEEQLVNSGTVLVKFWLHIDRDTQLKRFEARERDPDKEWKITGDDWRNRSKWDEYKEAVDEMLYHTSTTYAPWTIVESADKNYSRIKTLKTFADAIEKKIGPVD
jgi:polyphosphate:AMP phosphotransferase